ncbi:MAG TPA: DUF5069 domain-containing protein [Chthoniobacterales bacterium]|jgi:hypothetical protein
MNKIVPTIPSCAQGQLGLSHLPRLWQKSLLSAAGLLADGYKDIGPGYDHMVLTAIGIDPDAARTYIASEKPTYVAFERWIQQQPGVKLDEATIAGSNAAVAGYNHDDSTRTEILSAAGIPDNGTILGAVELNFIDDLSAFHASVTA